MTQLIPATPAHRDRVREPGPRLVQLADPDTGRCIEGRVRELRPSDTERLVAMFDRLSPTTVYRRFLSPVPILSGSLLRQGTGRGHADREACVLEVDDEIVAIARSVRPHRDPMTAYVAVTVEDRWQRNGLATQLLSELAETPGPRGARQVGRAERRRSLLNDCPEFDEPPKSTAGPVRAHVGPGEGPGPGPDQG